MSKTKKVFFIEGVHCSGCITNIKNELGDRGIKAEIESNGRTEIELNKKIKEGEIEKIINNLGYKIKNE